MSLARLMAENPDVVVEEFLEREDQEPLDVVSELCDDTDLSKSTKQMLFESLVLKSEDE